MRVATAAAILSGVVALLAEPLHAQSAPRFRMDPGGFMTEDDYPPLAAAEGRQGRTAVVVDVDATGRVQSCGIASSSGHADLDAQACQLMLRRARYAPARDAAGNVVAGRATQNVRWMLPAYAPAPVHTGTTSPSYTPAYTPAASIISQPAPSMPSPSMPAPSMNASQQMNADLQRNAAELLARKKRLNGE